MPPQRPGAYDPRPSSRAARRAKVAKPQQPKAVRQKLPVGQTAAAISKKTPEWFHISGVPVRPLTARESRRAPPTSNKARVLKPKTQVEVQKEKMVGTSPSNPHYFRLPYKRKDVGKGGVVVKGAQDRSKGSAVSRPAARPPSAPPAGARKPPTNPSAQEVKHDSERVKKNAKVHYTRFYEQKNVHEHAPSPQEVARAMKLRSVVSHDMPDWAQIPQVPVIHPVWKTKTAEIVVKQPPPFMPNPNLKEKGHQESCVSEAAPDWMHIKGLPKKPYRKPEPLSVKVSFENAESAAFGQKHPINFHYRREPHKQLVDQEHKREYTDCGNFHKYVSHHSAVSAKAPDFFHVENVPKAKVIEYHHQKGAHMRNMRPTTSGGVHEHPKNWRKSISSVSYDTPAWMKTYQTHIVNGPVHDVKMIAGRNNEVLVPRSEVLKVKILKEQKEKQDKKMQDAKRYAQQNPPYKLVASGQGERPKGLPSKAPRSRTAVRQAVPTNRVSKSNIVVKRGAGNTFVPQRPPSRARNPITGVGTNRYPTRAIEPPKQTTAPLAKPPPQDTKKVNSKSNVQNDRRPSKKLRKPPSAAPKTTTPQVRPSEKAKPVSTSAIPKSVVEKDALIHRLRSELTALRSRASSRGKIASKGNVMEGNAKKVVDHGAGSNTAYNEKMVLV